MLVPPENRIACFFSCENDMTWYFNFSMLMKILRRCWGGLGYPPDITQYNVMTALMDTMNTSFDGLRRSS